MSEDCYEIERHSHLPPTIYFEFDLNYGATQENVPPPEPDYLLEGKKITSHKRTVDGFRLEQDGNRIEIATKQFALTTAGRNEMDSVMNKILHFVGEVERACRQTTPLNTYFHPPLPLNYPPSIGVPYAFRISCLKSYVRWIFPIQLRGQDPYYSHDHKQHGWNCVAASPQATFELPLARVNDLVTKIKNSEKEHLAGKALSGPPGWRAGVRSQSIYDAQKNVNADRRYHILHRTSLPNGDVVTETNYSPKLQGLLILMISYLRASMLSYANDYENLAKQFLPINVKNPFRLLFNDLNFQEKMVFRKLYCGDQRDELWKLAKMPNDQREADGENILFPERTHSHQSQWFSELPTWNTFIDYTVDNIPLLRTIPPLNPDYEREHEYLNCEVLFAPYSRIIPYEKGSCRVAVEMRRLGFNWVFAKGYPGNDGYHPSWRQMTHMLFALAKQLNT